MEEKNLAKGTILITVSYMIFIASGYLINIWLGRSLGPELYGKYGVVIAVWTFVNLLLTAGLPQAVSKLVSANEEHSKSILRSSLMIQMISSLIITVLFFFSAELVAKIFKDASLIPYLRLSALIIPFYSFYSLYVGFYNGMHDFKKQALLNTIYPLVKVLGIIGLSYFFSLYGAIGGFIIAPLVALLFGLNLPMKSDGRYDYKPLISFSIPLIGFTIFSTLQQSLDLFMVKSMIRDPQIPGFYTASQNISRVAFFGLSAFSMVLYPSISKALALNNPEKAQNLISKSLRVVLLILMPGTLLVSAFSKNILKMLYSSAFSGATPTLSILTIGVSFLTIFTILASILNGAGMPKKSLLISASGVLTTFLIGILLIPTLGAEGAAISTTAGSLFSMALASFFVYQRFGVLTPWGSVFKITGSSAIIYLTALNLHPTHFMFIIYSGLLLILYFLLLLALRELKISEIMGLAKKVPVVGKIL